MNFEAYQLTEKKVRLSNGKEFKVYARQTKAGLRFYRWGMGSFFIVSKNDLI